ncbi:hypothetical protein QJS10_CPB13g01209 [Acorus calamus]|uniref:WD repeat-containing protein 55 n=1 Tax=Acorus calamus TaxID=4465 RepID=A0AAV9DFG6_ACOCL|nr:hypothetical protein QJS10_CPB13g01209 [Acorus calamus]
MEINLGKLPFGLDFHPSSNLVAAGLISGDLHLYRYGPDTQPQRLFAAHGHEESCRSVKFVDSGRVLLTASADCSILAVDVDTGAVIARLEDAHEAAINRLVTLTETTVSSGDDEGCIKVWDTRQRTCCNSFNAHEEYISDMTFVSSSMQLLGTSGDGTLSVCNLRRNKVQSRSEFSEDELLSIVTMKNGRKVVCGTQTGALLLYSWGHFKDCSDRFLGHPMSVDTLLKVDEDTLISGSEDGVIRLVGILPNRIIHPIAEHSEYPIEGLGFSFDRKFLGSISHDQMLKLWDMHELLESQKNASNHANEEMDLDGSRGRPANVGQASNTAAADEFFADL